MTIFASPNKPVTSTILPPRKKLTTQLPPRKSISIPSSIINLEHAVEISSWIDRRSPTYDITEIPYEFKLLLKGSRDGFDVKTFHKLCDNIPDLIVVIKVEYSNEILGGYNQSSWLRVNDQSNAIYYSQNHGPWFYEFGHHVSHGPKEWYYKSKGNTYQPPIRNTADIIFQ
ncbi:hypothetical protein C2G38_2114414 [Gigaspora rosea]|uniref:TLDc domain-containing protein n=1 Tax=Gigaspora rosea TaxID=44941 RepID=A0A397UA63_9GLOM|nr:hypothetical protein C2G38_2114414 [Gigaspora rosea]